MEPDRRSVNVSMRNNYTSWEGTSNQDARAYDNVQVSQWTSC